MELVRERSLRETSAFSDPALVHFVATYSTNFLAPTRSLAAAILQTVNTDSRGVKGS